MTHIIKASEVKPGMEVQWERHGFTHKGTVERVISVGGGWLTRFLSGASGMSVQSDVEVTVLSEPAPVQPEEPTWFGARVVVASEKFIRAPRPDTDPLPWFSESDGKWRNWAAILAMGPVTVIPDQGWTVPDTPEVPERIEEWPEDDTALRPYKWRERCGYTWTWLATASEWECYDAVGNYVESRGRPSCGPWERDTDA